MPRIPTRLLAAACLLGACLIPTAAGPAAAATTTEGIDVATSQSALDFGTAASDGKSFAVVKEGGSQLSDGPYVSPYYTRELDAARANGLKVGHYWVSGDFQTPTAAADYFVDHLHDYRSGDVVALDDEILDDSKNLWTDDSVSAFFTEVEARLGTVVPWFYISASPLRAHSWTKTIATGAKLWVASYGANDGSYPGAPDIGNAYPSWAVHQYTSNGRVGGTTVDLDRVQPGAFDPVSGGSGGGGGGSTGLPKTTTEQDGQPGTVFWQRCQHWLALQDGYTGPIDGDPGVNTYAALQRDLAAHWGYAGPIDGDPGTETYKAWQRMAATYGYTGPIDGELGPNSYRAIATFLNEDEWD